MPSVVFVRLLVSTVSCDCEFVILIRCMCMDRDSSSVRVEIGELGRCQGNQIPKPDFGGMNNRISIFKPNAQNIEPSTSRRANDFPPRALSFFIVARNRDRYEVTRRQTSPLPVSFQTFPNKQGWSQSSFLQNARNKNSVGQRKK